MAISSGRIVTPIDTDFHEGWVQFWVHGLDEPREAAFDDRRARLRLDTLVLGRNNHGHLAVILAGRLDTNLDVVAKIGQEVH